MFLFFGCLIEVFRWFFVSICKLDVSFFEFFVWDIVFDMFEVIFVKGFEMIVKFFNFCFFVGIEFGFLLDVLGLFFCNILREFFIFGGEFGVIDGVVVDWLEVFVLFFVFFVLFGVDCEFFIDVFRLFFIRICILDVIFLEKFFILFVWVVLFDVFNVILFLGFEIIVSFFGFFFILKMGFFFVDFFFLLIVMLFCLEGFFIL